MHNVNDTCFACNIYQQWFFSPLQKVEYHGSARVLAVANVTVSKPIGSDIIIRAVNLHIIRVKFSLKPLAH